MRRFAAVLSIAALMTGALAGSAGGAPSPAAAQIVGVTAGQDGAQIEVRDGTAVLSGHRAWPLGLHAPADGSLTAATWRRMAAGALVRLGAPSEVADSYIIGYGPTMQAAQPAGDLDGDGRDDVLVTTWQFSQEGASLLVQALRGSDGRELWSHTYDGFAHAAPGRVGPDGREGVIVVTWTWDEAGLYAAGVSESTTTVQWLAGDGTPSTTREFTGHAVRAIGGTAVRGAVTNVELVRATGGDATDVLVTQLDLLAGADLWRATATAHVIDGSDGTTAATATQENEDGREPIAMAGGDLDGTPGDDIVFVVADARWDSTVGSLVAASSADGATLWSHDELPIDPWVFLRNARDMTADGRHELMLSSFSSRTIVLDGATGRELWRRSAQVAFPAGDSDGDGRAEVGVMHMGYGSNLSGVHMVGVATAEPIGGGIPPIAGGSATLESIGMGGSSRPFPAGKVGVITKVIDGEGAVLRADRVLVDRAKGDHASRLQFQRVGDVDGDAVPDAFAAAVVADLERETVVSDRRLISGRTGATSWRPPLHTRAAGGALDADGDDIIATRGRKLQARDGRSGRLLWSAPAKLLRHGSGVAATDVTGDGRADVIITSYRGITVLDGRTGEQRWNVPAAPFGPPW